MNATEQTKWLTPAEVANELNLTINQVMALIRAGKIPAAKLSRKLVRVNAERLKDLLNSGLGNS